MRRGEGLLALMSAPSAPPIPKPQAPHKQRHKAHRRTRDRPWMNCPKVKARLKELRPFVRIDKFPVIISRVEPMKKIGFSHDRF